MKALISVSDKTEIVSFAQSLIEMGYEIISTGGTAKVLQASGITVTSIDEVTGFPEMLDGRVKTLHPKIHGGLLALRDNESHMKVCREHGIEMIDLVVVNLYPFEQTISKPDVTLDEAIENIDIGGPSMLRSAAKNYRSVGVVVNPKRYSDVIVELKQRKGKLGLPFKELLACEAFQHTAQYDATISTYLSETTKTQDTGSLPDSLNPLLKKVSELRYGENPHQKAAFYRISGEKGIPDLNQLHGKELSYNNIMDLESAALIVKELDMPGAVIIKHTNPCGAATGDSIADAYQKAYDADSVSAFGSIVGLNRGVNKETAELISKTFVEVVVAPSFDAEALKILTKKTALRLIELPHMKDMEKSLFYKYVDGGFLVQTANSLETTQKDLDFVTKKHPSSKQINDLLFAYKIVKYVKSNAVILVKDGQTMGIGAGQMSRVEATEIAIKKAGKNCEGAVMASDAFFPFKDSIELAQKAGVESIIQPGGSKRDKESIDFCNDHDISMAFTGVRHFRH